MKRIAVIPGDGIGGEVTAESVKVLQSVTQQAGKTLHMDTFPYSADHYLESSITLPDGALEELREYDALLMGAFGDPRVPDMQHAHDILLGIRFGLDLYINFRPVKLYDDRLSPLKAKGKNDIEFVVFRENTEGAYVGMGGIFKKGTPDEIAIQEDVNTRKGVERIIRYAFEYAKTHGKQKVMMCDKSNVLTYGHDLWQRTFWEVSEEHPEIDAQHLYVDALCMQLIKRPEQFQVIVTSNMFGDIITDLAAQLQGGLGIAPSANLHPGHVSMFEPVHGSVPKYAGKNIASPFASILCAVLLLDHIGLTEESNLVEAAVEEAIRENQTTRDLGGKLTTSGVGDYICLAMERLVE